MKELALDIIKKIYEYGYVGYIVGGFVRDSLLGLETSDIDITTNATPMELKNIFKQEDMVIMGYGSITLKYQGHSFEITTFRQDYDYRDYRHPSRIVYVNDLKTDLLRRDFTINTLCIDKDNQLVDLLHGQDDLKQKIIKTVIDSQKSFALDALRILRAIRFASYLDFTLSEDIVLAIQTNKHLLKELSYDCKKRELDKIFGSHKAYEGIILIKKFHLDEALELNHLERIQDYSDIVGIWAMINPKGYKFTSSEKDLIEKINVVYNLDNLDNHNLYKYGVYVNLIAGVNKGLSKNAILKKYEELAIKNRDDIQISVHDICKIYKRKAGAFLKDIYLDIENKILDNELENDNIAIQTYLASKLQENSN